MPRRREGWNKYGKKRSGEISAWATEHLRMQSGERYDCSYCDEPIVGGSTYTRRVFRDGSVLRVERRHECPECPKEYRGCGR